MGEIDYEQKYNKTGVKLTMNALKKTHVVIKPQPEIQEN